MTTNNEAWIKNLILELIETPNLDKAAKKWDNPNKRLIICNMTEGMSGQPSSKALRA